MARVLISVDDPSTRDTLVGYLAEEGHTAEGAESSRASAVELTSGHWDVVIVEAEQLNRAGLTPGRVRSDDGDFPEVVVVTHKPTLQTAAEALRTGAFDYLPEPISRPVLIKVVANAAQVKALRTEKKRLQRENRRHRDELERLVLERTQQIQAIFSNLPGVVFRARVPANGEESVLFVGGSSSQLLGIEPEALRKNPGLLEELVDPADRARFLASKEQARAARSQWRFDGRFRLAGGRVRFIRCVGQVAKGTSSEQLWDVLLMDVTDHKELEAQLLLADRMASVGTLTAGLAHDINNPLSAVVSDLEVLSEELSDERASLPRETITELSRIVKGARQGADHIARIVRDLRTFSRATEDRVSALDVREVAESSIRLAMNEIRHRARLERNYLDVRPVRGNEPRLAQVLLNLLIYLARSIPEGHADSHTLRVAVAPAEGRMVSVELSGTGEAARPPSRPPSVRGTSAFDGAGEDSRTNLYVCHSIVSALGGQLSRRQNSAGGLSFTILLPESGRELPEVYEAPKMHRKPSASTT